MKDLDHKNLINAVKSVLENGTDLEKALLAKLFPETAKEMQEEQIEYRIGSVFVRTADYGEVKSLLMLIQIENEIRLLNLITGTFWVQSIPSSRKIHINKISRNSLDELSNSKNLIYIGEFAHNYSSVYLYRNAHNYTNLFNNKNELLK